MKKYLCCLICFLFFLPLSAKKIQKLSIRHFENKIELNILGIVCDFCARSLEKTFKKQKEVKKIELDMNTNLLTIYLKKDMNIDDRRLHKLVKDAGFTVE